MLKKKKTITTFMSIAVASILLVACGTAETKGEGDSKSSGSNTEETVKKYSIGTDAAYAPFESFNDKGEIVGIDIDVINAVGEAIDVDFEVGNVGWEPLFQQVTNGELDIAVSAITITDDRKLTYDFTEPYYEATQLIVTKEGSEIESLADLKDKKISVQINTTGHYAAQDLQGKTSSKISPYETTPLAIQEVVNGTVDAAIGDNAVILEYIKNNPKSKLKAIEDNSFEKEYYGFMVKKGNKELVDLLNEGIKKVKESGKLKEITGQEIE